MDKINLNISITDELVNSQNVKKLESDAIILFTFEKNQKDENGNNAIVHMVTCGDDMISDGSVVDIMTSLIRKYIHKRHLKGLPNMEHIVVESFELDQIGDKLKAASNEMISRVPLSDREAIIKKNTDKVVELLMEQFNTMKENFVQNE